MRNNLFYFILILVSILVGLHCSDTQKKASDEETRYRPLVHFTPDSMWMNDPNGLVYHDGTYHLFYQYYPDSNVWGPMHWGHAVSDDLIEWQDWPIALYPDSLGYIFSGSAVIDKDNTSGLGAEAMIALFTHHDPVAENKGSDTFQYQSLAYSLDGGRLFEKYNQNPIINNPGIRDFRDPKVTWDPYHNKWIMVIAAYDKVILYSSSDLIHWQELSSFGIEGDNRLWECPDLFPIQVYPEGETKWILLSSIQQKGPNGGTATSYFVGDFDGTQFLADPASQQWLDYGKDNYAFVTWSQSPDNTPIGIGWMSNWQYAQKVPTQKWRSTMTLPRRLSLHKWGDGYLLKNYPHENIFKHSGTRQNITTTQFSIDPAAYIHIPIIMTADSAIICVIENEVDDQLLITLNKNEQAIFIDRTTCGETSFSEHFGGLHKGLIAKWSDTLYVDIFLDKTSIELFVNEGMCAMTDIFFPHTPLNKVRIDTSSCIIPSVTYMPLMIK